MGGGPNLKVFLADGLALEKDGVLIPGASLSGRQARLMFAYLVTERRRPVPRDELAEAIWGEAPPATWEKALTVIASRLRAALVECGLDGKTVLTGAPGCYRLDLPEGVWVDVSAAADAADEAEEALASGDLARASAAGEFAVSVSGRPFLPGEDGAWVGRKRQELAELQGRALVALSEARLRAGDSSEAVKWTHRAIELAPFRESGYRRLMEAYIAAGDRAEALRVYERCRLLLAEELGTYPSPETESIYRGLLARLPERAPPATRPPVQSASIQVTSAELSNDAQAPARGSPTGTLATRAMSSRRRAVLAAVTGAVVAASVAVTVVLGTRGSSAAGSRVVSADSVGMFHAGSGQPTGEIPVEASPSAITTGDGSVWVANMDADSVSRIDPAKETIIDTIPVGNDPDGIAFGAGFVWVTNGLDGTVTQINPVTNTPVQTINVGSGPAGVAVGSRYVWVANSYDGTVTRVDLRTDRPLPAISVGQGADGIAIGFGSVWVTSQAFGTVTRIDEGTGAVIQPIDAGNGAGAVAVGLHSVWVANDLDGTVTRIDPATNDVRATIGVGDGPNGIAVTAGAVWVSNGVSGSLSRIDPERNVTVQKVPTGNHSDGLALLGRTLYAAVGASGTAHRGGTLTVLTYAGNVSTLDPALVNLAEEGALLNLTSDGLIGYAKVGGSAGTNLVPDLAVSIPPPTDGGLTYTFQLHRDIRYSNGELLRPQDFRTGFERDVTLNGQLAAGYTPPIVGVKRCFKRPKRPCDLSQGIVTDDATGTVTFHLTSPDPDFYYELAVPVPPGTPFRPENVVPGTGPYRVVTFDPNHEIRLVRNRYFREWSWAAQPTGNPDVIVERLGGTADSRVRSVLRGSADLATGFVGAPSPALLQSLRTQHPSQLKENPFVSTWFIALNTRVPPFSNADARRALNFAIDREHLRDLTLGEGVGPLTCQILPPDFGGYERYCPYTILPSKAGKWTAPDLARARQLVRESGTTGQKVTFWVPPWIHFDAASGRYVVSVLDSLGYEAQLRLPRNDPYAEEDKLRLQAGFYAWGPNFAAPAGFIPPGLGCTATVQDGAVAQFCDPALDGEMARAEALQTTNPVTADALWAKLDRQLTNQSPWVTFANGVVLAVVAKRVGNYEYNPRWGPLLDQLWVR